MSISCLETIENFQKKVWNSFLVNEIFLHGTGVANEINIFNSIVNANIMDVNILRTSLTNYLNVNKNDPDALERFSAINNILVLIENEYFSERVGCTKLTTSTRQESFDGGVTYVTTLTSLIGPHSISNVSPFDDDTITGVIGNQRSTPITLLGITSSSPNSITDAINIQGKAVEAAIGKVALDIKGGVVLHKCTIGPNILGNLIYEVPPVPSLVDAFNGMMACLTWPLTTEIYGITNTGNADDCHIFSDVKAIPGCTSYLSGKDVPD